MSQIPHHAGAGAFGPDCGPLPATDEELELYRRLGPPVLLEDAGQRIDAYLARQFPFLSRSGWRRRLDAGLVLINGRVPKASGRVRSGDLFTMYAPPAAEPDVDRGIAVLWQDGPVMAVYKPGGLPMHHNGPYRKNTFTEIVWAEIGREWAAVHRLDRETSGIVLCGATNSVRSRLAQDFAARRVQKEYLAIARGRPAEPKWHVDAPIGDLRDSAIRIKKWVVPDGLSAETAFEVEGLASEACLLRARPLTGRTNQIRIHAAYGGHVLYGDKLFHRDEAVFLEYWEHGATANVLRQTGFARHCLHAAALTFTVPGQRGEVRVECALPPDMAGFWQQLGATAGHKGGDNA